VALLKLLGAGVTVTEDVIIFPTFGIVAALADGTMVLRVLDANAVNELAPGIDASAPLTAPLAALIAVPDTVLIAVLIRLFALGTLLIRLDRLGTFIGKLGNPDVRLLSVGRLDGNILEKLGTLGKLLVNESKLKLLDNVVESVGNISPRLLVLNH
jgi:hypothetical protein